MNERSPRKSNRSIERALAARWCSQSPDPRFVARLENSLAETALTSRRAARAREVAPKPLRIPLLGWVTIGISVLAAVAMVWFGTQSMPLVIEATTATPSTTVTSVTELPPEAAAPPVIAMLESNTPNPSRLPLQLALPQVSPDPLSARPTTPSLTVNGPGSAMVTPNPH